MNALLVATRFAHLLATIVMFGGLAFVVIALAAVNLFFGFCAGCFVYFQLQRLRR